MIDLYDECCRWRRNAPNELTINEDGSLEIDVDGYGATLKREDFGVCGESFLAAYLFAAVSYQLQRRSIEMDFMNDGELMFKVAYLPHDGIQHAATIRLTLRNASPRYFSCLTPDGRTEALMRAYNEYLEAKL